MGLILNTNVPSLIAQRHLLKNTLSVNSSYEKLASGYRINRASDDAAGLNISETLQTQIRGNQKAVHNAMDGVNILQIAEGALSVVSENLQRIRELTIQAANDTNSSTERRAIGEEIQSRLDDITRIADTTRGNNINLLDGSKTDYLLQIGANSNLNQNTLDIGDVLSSARATALSISTTVTATGTGALASNGSCRAFLDQIDAALSKVFSRRSKLGALQNRLQSTIESLSIAIENLQTTNSRIRNLDIAAETASLTRNQILQQSSIGILAQANQAPTLSLKLLNL